MSFSRGCLGPMSYRKSRNLISVFMVAIATAFILQVFFGKRSFLLFGSESGQPKTPLVSKLQRHNTVNDIFTTFNAETDREVSPSCYPDNLKPDEIKTLFKFYIYNLPAKFNYDIQKNMSMDKRHAFCYDLMYCGTGKELSQFRFIQGRPLFYPPFKGRSIYTNFTMSIRDTQQFSLEVIIHYKLLHSKYRTLDPRKADLFYIPAYTGLKCLQDRQGAARVIQELFEYLKTNESKYFNSGKPHFSTLSKIQREQGSDLCNTLQQKDSEKISYIDIEKEANPGWEQNKYIFGKSIIVAPYPSYIHFGGVKHDQTLLEYRGDETHLRNSQFSLNVPSLSDRNVLLFLAAGSRRSNTFRAKIIDQFPFKTHGSYGEYIKEHSNIMKRSNSSNSHQVMLITNECSSGHRTTTIPWMVNSVFCLQPPGDSPTRKSFYDSILSGCIPIIFKERFNVTYPFQRYLDYKDFTVTIDAKLISDEDHKIMTLVQQIPPETVRSLHRNLLRVAKWFQYSLSDGGFQEDDDAITLILQQLRDMHHLY